MFEKQKNKHDDNVLSQTLFEIENNSDKPIKYIVKVLLDLSLPHMDKIFDYEVDENYEKIEFGLPVTVPFANRNLQGWIVDYTKTNNYPEKILKIKSIDSKYPLLTPQIYELAKKLAKRYVTNTSEIVKLAVQNRQIRVEKSFKPKPDDIEINYKDIPQTAITQYHNGEKLLENLRSSTQIKASLTLTPYYGTEKINWIYSLILPTLITVATNKQVIILLPTKKQCTLVQSYMEKYVPLENIATINSEDVGSTKYTNYLKILSGQAKVVLGTQNAVFAPTKNLGLIICFDDANLNYQSQKSPYINIRQVAIERIVNEKASLILAGFNKSIHMRQVENVNWALPLEITPQLARKKAPKIICPSLLDEENNQNRISSITYETIKKGLEKGPVLIQVGTKGYYSKIVCTKCFTTPKCNKCKHLLSMQENYNLTCVNCANIYETYKCRKCDSKQYRAIRSGDNKTAHELGKIFPSIPILTSNSQTPINDYIDDRARIIISTPGSEPIPINGYTASIILDIDTIYELPAFWAQTESFRRWFNIAGLTRQDGTVVIDGKIEPHIAAHLQTWNINKLLDEILSERKNLDLPPHTRLISLKGNHQQIRDTIEYVEKENYQTLGIIPKPNNEAMTIIRTSIKDSKNILELLKNYLSIRSLKKLPKIKVQVDPIDLW